MRITPADRLQPLSCQVSTGTGGDVSALQTRVVTRHGRPLTTFLVVKGQPFFEFSLCRFWLKSDDEEAFSCEVGKN